MPTPPIQLDPETTSAETLEAERKALDARRAALQAEQAALEAKHAALEEEAAKQAALALAARQAAAEQTQLAETQPEAAPEPERPGAPLSFIPHDAEGHAVPPRVKIRSALRSARYGDLDDHDLVRLLDSIEDELARRRFRESIYISLFVWLLIVGLVFFGPKYLWHAPELISPAQALKQHELLTLNSPVLPRHASPAPKLDSGTLKKLRAITAKPTPPAPTETPVPATPTPAPTATTQPTTAQPTPQPLPSAPSPVPHSNAQPMPDTPLPQPSSRPNFNTPNTASDSMRDLANNVAKSRGGTIPMGSGMGTRGNGRGASVGQGLEVLSDTKGVDFQPYIARIMREIYEQWIPLIPEEARPPLSKQGVTQVRFKINADGTIGGMWLDGPSHDVALDRAAWGSITGVGQFPPLPKQFTGPNLELRIHYLVNTNKE
jgi:TonB family protein